MTVAELTWTQYFQMWHTWKNWMASLLFPACPFLFLLITVDQCRSVNKQRQPYYVSVYTSACFSSVASHRVRLADACSQHPGHKTPRSAQCLRTATAHSNPERGQRPAAPQRPLPAPPATPPGGRGLAGGGRGLAQAPPPWRVPPRAARSSPEPVTAGAREICKHCRVLRARSPEEERAQHHPAARLRHRSAMCRWNCPHPLQL